MAAGVVLLLLAGTLAVNRFLPNGLGTGLFGRDGASSIASAIGRTPLGADFLKLIGQRSPGARVAGELADSKARRLAQITRPHQRALPKIRRPGLPEDLVKSVFAPPTDIAPPGPVLPQLADVLTPPVFAGVPPVLGFSPPGGGGVIVGPPGGPGTPPITIEPPVTPPIITPPTTPAVPEPGTWAMMLIGFGAAGVALRRRSLVPIAQAS